MIRPLLLSAALVLAAPISAFAQAVPDQAEAKRLLFNTRNAQVRIVAQPFLTAADTETLRQMPRVAQLNYYGAMAAAPAEGLQSEATRGAFNYHSLEAARAAAVQGCNAARKGGAACQVIAEVVPRRFEDGRPLTLSQAASKAVQGRDLRRAGSDAALAISRSTGAWAIGSGGNAAISACAAKGASDCEVAVAQ